MLADAGYEASCYTSARDFYEYAMPFAARSCLILDVHMPEAGGIEIGRKLAMDNIFVPIIFVTGRNGPSLRAKVAEIGGIALLDKPVDKSALTKALALASARL